MPTKREVADALRPFASFWRQWERQPIAQMGDEFYGIHVGTKYEASLSRSDCRRAAEVLDALEAEGARDD